MPVLANEIKFSILILSIPSRMDSLTQLMNNIQKQIDEIEHPSSVEILVLLDNRSKTISEKRNDLLRSARGNYIAYLDDDDKISNEYVSQLINAIDNHNGVDCISFNQFCYIDDRSMNVSFGIGNPHGQLWITPNGTLGDIKRPPYHMCLWRRELAKSEEFAPLIGPNGQSYGEDLDWILRLSNKAQTEHHINNKLHIYVYNSKTTTSLVSQK